MGFGYCEEGCEVMKTYVVWFSETETYKMYFQAENLEHAKDLLDKVNAGDIDTMDLPEVDKNSKDYEIVLSMETLEEIGE